MEGEIMQSDTNGCSTCSKGKEHYEYWTGKIDGIERIQYDYRTPEGKLFSTIGRTLEICRNRRDKWLKERG